MNPRRFLWLPLVALVAGILFAGSAMAQLEGNLSSYTGKNAEGYLKPLQEGFGAGLHDAIFRSAYIPRDGFNINVEFKGMIVNFSDEDRTFDAVTEDGVIPEQTIEAPTIVGDLDPVYAGSPTDPLAAFPGGLDMDRIALAAPQITVGSVAGTQAIIRYIAVETGDAEIGDVSLLGLGARHSISQYIQNPPVDLAAGFMWQDFKLGDDLITATGFTFGVQGSKMIASGYLEPYLGLSYDSFSMSVDYESEVVDEKLSVDFDADSSLGITAGMGINLKVVHLHAEFSSASQTSFAFGLSLGN